MSQRYYYALARRIADADRDHALLRALIYRDARAQLRKELDRRRDEVGQLEINEQIFALDKAIEQLEADLVDDTRLLTFASRSSAGGPLRKRTDENAGKAIVVAPDSAQLNVPDDYEAEASPAIYPSSRITVYNEPLPAISNSQSFVSGSPTKPVQAVGALFGSTVQLVLAAILGVAIYVGIQRDSNFFTLIMPHPRAGAAKEAANESSRGETKISPPSRSSDVPIPSAYGVYAVNHGNLIDLPSLPIRVPDQRVGISAMISTPSGKPLPDGHLQFVAFRRDLMNSAPDRVTIRVVARVMRALTFGRTGKAKVIKVEGSWAVRSKAYDMKVIPMNESPEMVTIRSDDPNFSLPAGRYALVLKSLAYDFSVEGPITDRAQCLERTDALDAPVYTECRNP